MDNASRGAPPRVPPVVIDGIRYSQVLSPRRVGIDAYGGGWMVAHDDRTGEQLWTLRVYEIVFNLDDEIDVQETYFERMDRVHGRRELLVRNERGDRFLVDVDTRTASAVP